MKTHSRRLSMALAIVMVLSLLVAFPAVVSAADTNLAVGLTPAVLSADGNTEVGFLHTSGAQALTAMTDGSDYGSAQAQTVEFLGTARVWNLTFTLAETSTLSSVAVYVFDGVTSGEDDTRGWNESAFAVTVDGVAVAGVGAATSGLTYGYANTKYVYTFNAPVAGKTVKITASSPAYVLAIGEIEIMGSVGTSGEGGGSTDTPVVTPGTSANYVSGIAPKSVYSEYKGSNVVFGTDGSAHASGAQTTAVLSDGANATAQAEALELLGTACDWDVTFDMGAVKSDVSSVVIYTRNSHATDSDERGWDSTKLTVQVSDDETTWTTVAGSYAEVAADGYTNLKATYTFNAAVSARFIKITVYSTAYVLALGEIEVWGGASSGGDTPSTDSFALAMTASDAQYNGADCVAVDIVVNNITKALLGVDFNIAFDASVMTPVLASDGSIVVDVVAGPTTENLSAVYTAGASTVNVNMIADVDKYADEAAFYAAAVSANGGIALRVYFTSTVPAGASTTVSVGSANGLWMTATDGGYVTGKGASAKYSVAEEVVYYDVTFVAGNGGTLSGTTTVSVEAGTDLSTVTFPTATPNTGYDFVAWDKTSGAINSATTVTASFAIKTFTVTFVAGANGTLSGTTTATVNYGTDLSAVTFPTPVANEGYEFDAWDKTSGAITATTTVTASFKAKATEPEVPVVGDFTLTEAAKATYSIANGKASANSANTYLYGAKVVKNATTTAADIKALFSDAVSIKNKSGAAVADTAAVGSGYRVYNAAGDKYIEIVMVGDVVGNGKVNATQCARLKQHITAPNLTGACLEAANTRGSAFTVNNTDLAFLKTIVTGANAF